MGKHSKSTDGGAHKKSKTYQGSKLGAEAKSTHDKMVREGKVKGDQPSDKPLNG